MYASGSKFTYLQASRANYVRQIIDILDIEYTVFKFQGYTGSICTDKTCST